MVNIETATLLGYIQSMLSMTGRNFFLLNSVTFDRAHPIV